MAPSLPVFPFTSQRDSSAAPFDNDNEAAEPLDTFRSSSSEEDQNEEKQYASTIARSRAGRVGARSTRPDSLLRRALDHKWVVVALVVGVVLGQARWTTKEGSTASLAVGGLRGEVMEGVWEPVYGVHDLSTMGTKTERPVGMPECERTMLFDWVRSVFSSFPPLSK